MTHAYLTRLVYKITVCMLVFILFAPLARAQWESQQSGTTVRLRGVSAVNGRVAWASGDKGTYARTTDGGRSWVAGRVPGAEALDFRDVDAFSADTAYLLAIGEGEKSRIYKTTDGGRSWTMQFMNKRPTAFFDCMAFWDKDRGVALSDPVDGRFLIITTSDGGRTWKEVAREGMPLAVEGEGAFAASGTCIAVAGRRNAWFGTGGPNGARVFRSTDGGLTWAVTPTPLTSGKSAGVFSLAFRDARHGVAVGGDYTLESAIGNNAAWTDDGGQTWHLVGTKRPNGYRSAVAFVYGTKGSLLVSVGPNGSDLSTDGGKSWRILNAEGFHSVSFSKLQKAGWAVGESGRISRYIGP